MRFLSGWRLFVLVAAMASLVLMPVTTSTAAERSELGKPSRVANDDDDSGNIVADGVSSTPAFARSNYAWPYATGPYYGDVRADLKHAAGTLTTAVGSFRPAEGLLNLPEPLKTQSRLTQVGAQYFVVQFDGPGGHGQLQQLLAKYGRDSVGSMPVMSFVAKLDAGMVEAVSKLPGVIAVQPYQAAWKLSPMLGRVPLVDRVKAISEVYSLEIRVWQGEDPQLVVNSLTTMGGTHIEVAESGTITVDLHRSKLRDLAQIDAVASVRETLIYHPMDEKDITTMQTGAFNQGVTPYTDAGIDGTGQILMILDTGIKLDAGDLSDTRTTAGVAGTNAANAAPDDVHRKVLAYRTTPGGDNEGCDTDAKGGFTHGQFVASTALGNASRDLPGTYGAPYFALDDTNPQDTREWDIVGVAPQAKLIFYDGQSVPGNGSCSDPVLGGIDPGTLYGGSAGSGSMGASYTNDGARVFNFSWGTTSNTYSENARQIDEFIFENPEAMVFVAAGNASVDDNSDGVPDPGTLGEPATTKNGVAMGASFTTSSLTANGNEEFRAAFSSVGPVGGTSRIAPQLMAPGSDTGAIGPASSYACKTSDNTSGDPVECDVLTGRVGTSFATPAAAGAALLVRDYFNDGWYPEGVQISPANDVSSVSGALVKAVLVASADFMNGQSNNNLSKYYRVNNEQGWGRIQLDEVLPLEGWSASATGLVVVDGAGNVPNLLGGGITGTIDADNGGSQNSVFEVCDDKEELRLALVWTENYGAGMSGALVNNLDLTLESPTGVIYQGNYFTDDDDRNGVTDPTTEDCPPAVPGSNQQTIRDATEWSHPACTHVDLSTSPYDVDNPIEMIVLSPDYNKDGGTEEGSTDPDPSDDNQLEVGNWTVTVDAPGGGDDTTQDYALVIAGAICRGSAVTFDKTNYSCNEFTEAAVIEKDDPGIDPLGSLTPAIVAGRTTLKVYDENGMEFDSEAGTALGFVLDGGSTNRFTAKKITMTDQLEADSGNGVLEVRDGYTVKAIYDDVGPAATTITRTATAAVNCRVKLGVNVIQFAQFGKDNNLIVNGGCEQNGRGQFETGAPDRYMDEGEAIVLNYGFTSNEGDTLQQAEVNLRCVYVDGDSPADCRPGSNECADPDRENNTACSEMSILNTPMTIGEIPAGQGLSANFNILMSDSISGTVPAELVFEITAKTSGKTAKGVSVSAVTLNADEDSTYYSTDYPMGGTEMQDRDNDEVIENPVTVLSEVNLRNDLRYETVEYSSLFGTAGDKNQNLQAPWFFDLNDGGYRSGLNAATDFSQITTPIRNWGEDFNFNNQLDWFCSLDDTVVTAGGQPGCDPGNDLCGSFAAGVCEAVEDADPEDGGNGTLDQNWSTSGGCGWQTKAPGTCSGGGSAPCYVDDDCPMGTMCSPVAQATGGIWHTGTIGGTAGTCTLAGGNNGQCQLYETVGGNTRQLNWIDLLVSPEVQRVSDDPNVQLEITNWAWNMSIDLADNNGWYGWQFDNDSRKVEPFDLFNGIGGYAQGFGAFGAKTEGGNGQLNNGFNLFTTMSPSGTLSLNGSKGNNRVGKNSCYFEGHLHDDALRNSERCLQNYHHGCLSEAEYRTIDGLSDPRDDDLNNGVCTHDDQISCSKACSVDGAFIGDATLGQFKPCSINADCPFSGTCVGRTAACVTAEPCTMDAECTSGAGGVCIAYEGTCSVGSQYEGNPCVFNEECADNALPTIVLCNRTTPAPSKVCEYSCDVTGSAIDEYVSPAGPMRNYDMQAWNGPDLRVFTIEDAFGDTGEFFRGAIMMRVREASPTAPAVVPGYGLGIDDPVVEWREFSLIEDQTDCTPSGGPGNGGECASIDVASANFFEGNSLLTITVFEKSPSGNDCNNDGMVDMPLDFDCDNDGTPDVTVKAQNPLSEPTGEVAILNQTDDPSGFEYRGTLPISASYDAPGVLFLQQIGTTAPFVEITYVDNDDGTGRNCKNSIIAEQQGRVQAFVSIGMTTGNLTVAGIILTDSSAGNPDARGDGDGFADTNETVAMQINVVNSTGQNLTDVKARLSSNDPNIDCVLRPEISVGDMPAVNSVDPTKAPSVLTTEAFLFRVAPSADRVGTCATGMNACTRDSDCTPSDPGECSAPFDALSASMTITLSSAGDNKIASSVVPQAVTVDLDLDAQGGSMPTTYTESFEGGTFNSFVTANLDFALGTNAAADGYRCQYSNPDWPISNVYGDSEANSCFPGSSNAVREAYYWRINNADPNSPSPDGGRAYDGTKSLYFGIYGPAADENTTPVGILEAIRSFSPINLGWDKVCDHTRTINCLNDTDCEAADVGATCVSNECSNGVAGNCTLDSDCDEVCVPPASILSFKQQVSLMDNPPHGCVGPVQGAGRTADRAVMQVQLAGEDDPIPQTAPGLGPWIKVDGRVNGYEIQPADNFISCMYDPIDDGNTEDSWFDAADPNRRLGPSSTCFPEFVWAALGNTDAAFDANDYWRADGPGLEGDTAGNSLGGTWVQTEVDLSRFRGRRVRVRFVETGINDPTSATWEELFSPLNPNDCDDGWWLDDFEVTDTLVNPAQVLADINDNSNTGSFPLCPGDCSTITTMIDADPVATMAEMLPAPGLAVELDASGSSPDQPCVGGVVQYQFWIDGSKDGIAPNADDTLVRDWTDNGLLVQAPGAGSTRYVVNTRCSSAPSCVGSTFRDLEVDCPTSGARTHGSPIFQTIFMGTDKNTIFWADPHDIEVIGGSLASVSTYAHTLSDTDTAATSYPPSGTLNEEWYLIREAGSAGGEFCNSAGGANSWSSGGVSEDPDRDAEIVFP